VCVCMCVCVKLVILSECCGYLNSDGKKSICKACGRGCLKQDDKRCRPARASSIFEGEDKRSVDTGQVVGKQDAHCCH